MALCLCMNTNVRVYARIAEGRFIKHFYSIEPHY